MPWWLQRVCQLQENDGYHMPQQTPRMCVPASPVHSASDDEIDLTHTDNESESEHGRKVQPYHNEIKGVTKRRPSCTALGCAYF